MSVHVHSGIGKFAIDILLRCKTISPSPSLLPALAPISLSRVSVADTPWATMVVVNAMLGFGRRGKSILHIEGISISFPRVIEVVVVDEPEKLLSLLPEIECMADDNGVMTFQEAFAI
jgi:hypothetical protein